MGTAFQHLVDLLAGDSLLDQEALGAAGGDQAEAHGGKAAGGVEDPRLVGVLDRDEGGAGYRHLGSRSELALGEGHLIVAIEPHDLAGRAHLGAEHGIDTGEAGKGNTASLTPT